MRGAKPPTKMGGSPPTWQNWRRLIKKIYGNTRKFFLWKIFFFLSSYGRYNTFIGVGAMHRNWLGNRHIPPRKIPAGSLHPGCFPPEHSPPTKPGFAKYVVDTNLFSLESSILTRAKRARNRNNAATNRKKYSVFFVGNIPWGNIPGWNVPGGVYLEPLIVR